MHLLTRCSIFVVMSLMERADVHAVRLDLTGDWTVSNAAKGCVGAGTNHVATFRNFQSGEKKRDRKMQRQVAEGISVVGQVPGSVHTALLDNKRIQDPLYRDNDVKLAWIGHENWTYTRYFEVDTEIARSDAIILVAEGVNTISNISINDHYVHGTTNMFVKYTFDVKPYMKPGNNSIQFRILSATGYATKQDTSYPYQVPPNCSAPVQHGECHVNFIRKEQCSFSWDMGPSFPTQGIWKPIYIEAFNRSVLDIATVEVVQNDTGHGWVLRTKTYFRVSGTVSGTLQISLNGTGISVKHDLTLTPSSNWANFNVSVPQSVNVTRWWPNGFGKQTLYTVSFVFTARNGDVTSGNLRIGFRTVELIQDPVSSDPKKGLTFYFKVNGRPIFLRGANWIPADSFQERITQDKLRTLLQSVVDANMNCMRVWGGGVYESNDFYDLADELGILIWQDLMFASAMYPTDVSFLDSVTQEVRYQVRRLMHRPSILLWAGNSENEKALRENRFGTSSNYTRYYNDYVKLYVTTIKPIVNGENPDRIYLTSTPSNGKETDQEGYVAKDPGSELYGDIHFFNYSMNQWKPDGFPIPRFASQYGIQAWCNYETLLSVFEPSDMNDTSVQANHRQHHAMGDEEMKTEIMLHLKPPSCQSPGAECFRKWIYLTQINQAMSVKSQTEHYRRHQGKLLPDGRGLTMGALYWQLNDIWQAPTWSSIDYSGRWKMLHYYAKNFFDPILISPYLNGDYLEVDVVADGIPPGQKISGLSFVSVYMWLQFQPIIRWINVFELNMTSTTKQVMRETISNVMKESNCADLKLCFIHTHVFVFNRPDLKNENWAFLTNFSHYDNKANVSIAGVIQDSKREFNVSVATNAITPFVWLEAKGIMGRFSDNGFLLYLPKIVVKFYAWQDVDLATLKSKLVVYSLLDAYKLNDLP